MKHPGAKREPQQFICFNTKGGGWNVLGGDADDVQISPSDLEFLFGSVLSP